jgi:hypothetical protein
MTRLNAVQAAARFDREAEVRANQPDTADVYSLSIAEPRMVPQRAVV